MKNTILLIVMLTIAGCSDIISSAEETESQDKDTFTFMIENVLTSTGISCGSNSMGLVLNCKDTVYLKEEKRLREGELYVYEKGNITVVHRLIKDCTRGCFGLIFKGDNNLKPDKIVNKSQILGRIVRVDYK